MKHARHGASSAKGILRKCCFGQLEPKTWFLRERESAANHAHRWKAEPLLPDLLLARRCNTAADLLYQEVRSSRIRMKRRHATDGTFAGMRRHRDTGERSHLPYFPQRRNAPDVVDIGLQNVHDSHFDKFANTVMCYQALSRSDGSG